MPILKVKIATTQSTVPAAVVASTLSELTTRILGKDPAVTSILVEYVDPADWFVGGRPLVEQGRSSIYFDIKITDETNTKQQKADYIREAFEAFSRLFGDLHEESYIHVEDVRAAAYGYGGRTQEWRFHNSA
ncbi:hypothetical protein LDO26_17590 [Luteimonas sp. BDR2-5]|uniref:tautomerase family protein n=1 Tax=Proluteimonas luteida TaxID=2878685 RepID=UPI001E4F1898|nr:hypothetical protein [Luteimonas sp. BDR2-5]MCD9030006.1 hypothetical protein [Luteimonas sp. BDR2-5]